MAITMATAIDIEEMIAAIATMTTGTETDDATMTVDTVDMAMNTVAIVDMKDMDMAIGNF